jgi:phosphoribosylformylglycinamidine cyclo-ligase
VYDPKKPSTQSVLKLIKKTWITPYIKVYPNTYALFEKKFNNLEVDHTDGIGTKGAYHWKKKTFKNAVIDSLAMNLNDLLLVRAKAYKLQNHLVLPKDDSLIIQEIMSNLVSECLKRKIAITGGETSIHNTDDSFDISITISGFINQKTANKAIVGDVLVGLKSSGLHSNGFTLVRKLFGSKFKNDFVTPTKIYYDDLINLFDKIQINGMMHITGGAFSKLKGVINEKTDLVISDPIKPQKIFYEIYKKGISNTKMYTTFNCGIGFILTMPEKEALKFLKLIPYSKIIGTVQRGLGNIVIQSSFDKKVFKL